MMMMNGPLFIRYLGGISVYLDEIELKGYRNYQWLSLKFSRHYNVVIGANAQGKTNILEAIYFLSQARSHRRSLLKDLVRWEDALFSIKATTKNSRDERTLEVALDRENQRRIKINGVEKHRLSDLIGNLRVVLFSPEDLKIIKEGPEERRDFLNEVLSQLSPGYSYLNLNYLKVLKQRNALLKEIKAGRGGEKAKTLPIWDEKLVEFGVKITIKRAETVIKLTPLVAQAFQHISSSGSGERFELDYVSSIIGSDRAELETEHFNEAFRSRLAQARELEIERGVSLVGPHRDDVEIMVNGIDLRIFGSQGEHRTAALALKLAELELLKSECGEPPLLLLDDVMSELDEGHRSQLMSLIAGQAQVIFTTTNPSYFSPEHLKEARLIEVSRGKAKVVSDG